MTGATFVDDENDLKQLVKKYYVEPDEIHFITEKGRAKYGALTT